MYIPSKLRKIRDVLLPTIIGISIGYLIGSIFFYDSEYDSDILENVHIANHHHQKSSDSNYFHLRCVIFIHSDASKPEKIISALDDGYTKHCNETIYYSNDGKLVKKLEKKYPIKFVDLYGSHFYWSFYQHVMKLSSEIPAQWTFIGDDQNYLMVPNLRKTLLGFDSGEKIVMGKVQDSNSFLSWIFPFSVSQRVSVRGGVVLSNPAIIELAMCRGFFFPRSSELSLYECSKKHGIRVVDPFDEDSLRLFNDLPPIRVVTPLQSKSWFSSENKMKGKCSDHAITFGQMSMKEMRVVEFGMKLKVFGRGGVEVIKNENPDNSTIAS